MPSDDERLIREIASHEEWLGQQPGMIGVGLGLDRGGQEVIKVFTHEMPIEIKQEIAYRFSTPVDFEETGSFHAQ
jgi:hypothetical protein